MRIRVFLLALLFTNLLTACLSDDDEGEKWDAAKVCPETGSNAYGMPNRGTFTDERDGEVYRYTTIGDQVWMAENLRFALPYPYSFCYGIEACYVHEEKISCKKDTTELAEIAKKMRSSCTDNDCIADEYCKKFGRYYSLKDKGTEASLLNRDVVDSVCPKGWHVPSKIEWQILFDNVENDVSRLLNGDVYLFEYTYGVENDICGYSVLYTGYNQSSEIKSLFNAAHFWSRTADGRYYVVEAYFSGKMSFTQDFNAISLRCLKD